MLRQGRVVTDGLWSVVVPRHLSHALIVLAELEETNNKTKSDISFSVARATTVTMPKKTNGSLKRQR